jgi:hypothetical protein
MTIPREEVGARNACGSRNVLRHALIDALDDLAGCDVASASLTDLGEALETAAARFATWACCESVDLGGLE